MMAETPARVSSLRELRTEATTSWSEDPPPTPAPVSLCLGQSMRGSASRRLRASASFRASSFSRSAFSLSAFSRITRSFSAASAASLARISSSARASLSRTACSAASFSLASLSRTYCSASSFSRIAFSRASLSTLSFSSLTRFSSSRMRCLSRTALTFSSCASISFFRLLSLSRSSCAASSASRAFCSSTSFVKRSAVTLRPESAPTERAELTEEVVGAKSERLRLDRRAESRERAVLSVPVKVYGRPPEVALASLRMSASPIPLSGPRSGPREPSGPLPKAAGGAEGPKVGEAVVGVPRGLLHAWRSDSSSSSISNTLVPSSARETSWKSKSWIIPVEDTGGMCGLDGRREESEEGDEGDATAEARRDDSGDSGGRTPPRPGDVAGTARAGSWTESGSSGWGRLPFSSRWARGGRRLASWVLSPCLSGCAPACKRACTTRDCLPRMASWRAVVPSRFLAFTSAPCCASHSTTVSYPPTAASMSAVVPSFVVAFKSAPKPPSHSTITRNPVNAAPMTAVKPSRVHVLMSTPHPSSQSTTCTLPIWEAHMKGVTPLELGL
mmetsp:Transcript_7206/g.16435  ORF Transcript_7206/g.16435 Transcript_7206/m.16435 type:complete len:560 (+) Transcript_7206:769-2448(+)